MLYLTSETPSKPLYTERRGKAGSDHRQIAIAFATMVQPQLQLHSLFIFPISRFDKCLEEKASPVL